MTSSNVPSGRSEGMSNRAVTFFSHMKWQNLVAGVSGGLISTLFMHPLDLVKIRFQVNEGTGVTQRPQYRGLWHALTTIHQVGGIQGLYRGFAPNATGAGLSWGIYFLIYNTFKVNMQSGDTSLQLSSSHYTIAAAGAGALTLLMVNPIWVTKTRLCLQYEAEQSRLLASMMKGSSGVVSSPEAGIKQYQGMGHALYTIGAREGIQGLYKGLLPGLFGTSHGALQFMAYEGMKNRYNNYHERSITTKLTTAEYLTFAALSKMFAATVTYPYQVVRSRLQDQHRQYAGSVDVIKQIWKFEGVRGYYKGLWPSILRVTPTCCITFIVYENLISWL